MFYFCPHFVTLQWNVFHFHTLYRDAGHHLASEDLYEMWFTWPRQVYTGWRAAGVLQRKQCLLPSHKVIIFFLNFFSRIYRCRAKGSSLKGLFFFLLARDICNVTNCIMLSMNLYVAQTHLERLPAVPLCNILAPPSYGPELCNRSSDDQGQNQTAHPQ